MASNSSRVPLLRALAKRSYATQTKPATCATSEVKVTTLPNKMVVVSADCYNQGLVKVTVAVKAGSRYETPDNFGVSHVVRSSAGLATASASKFNIMRNLQQLGSTLVATSDRETITYTLETTCNNLSKGLEYLKYVTTEPCFKPWELSDNIPRIEYELANLPDVAILLDDLHKAAFRTGLGNSIFAKSFNLKSLGTETLQHYVNKNFLPSRVAVSGVGVNHDALEEFANKLCFHEGQSESCPSKYHGGEIRHEKKSHLTHVAIAAESSGLSKKEVFTYEVLKCALGGGPASVKWGCGTSPLAKALESVAPPSAAQAFHATHSDSGLFGIVVSSTPHCIREAVESATKALKCELKDDDIARGKRQLMTEVLFNGEECGALVDETASQAILVGGARGPRALAEAVEQVTTAQVREAHQKIISGKKSMASIGITHTVPYLDEI